MTKGISCLTCSHKHEEVTDWLGVKEQWIGCSHQNLAIETTFDMEDAAKFFCALHSDEVAVNRMLLADDLLDALIEADSMIEMEPYEHVAQEAAEAHENIRETIKKAKAEGEEMP
jgi:ATP-dependent exoDNAse (exonuclease V) alpha subunit